MQGGGVTGVEDRGGGPDGHELGGYRRGDLTTAYAKFLAEFADYLAMGL